MSSGHLSQSINRTERVNHDDILDARGKELLYKKVLMFFVGSTKPNYWGLRAANWMYGILWGVVHEVSQDF